MSTSPRIVDREDTADWTTNIAALHATPRRERVAGQISAANFVSPLKSSRTAKVRKKTLRRLRGFLAEHPAGLETLVVFVVDNKPHEYYLPSKYLKHSGITEMGQPFEMDEYEEERDGKLSFGTEFRAMAPASAAQQVTTELTDEEVSLRDAILSYRES